MLEEGSSWSLEQGSPLNGRTQRKWLRKLELTGFWGGTANIQVLPLKAATNGV